MNDLQLRTLTAEDLPAYWKLACAAFHSKNPGLEDEGAFLENCVKKDKAEKENPTALGNCLTRTGLFCEGKLLSTLTANAFEIHFDGTVCPPSDPPSIENSAMSIVPLRSDGPSLHSSCRRNPLPFNGTRISRRSSRP